MDGAVFTGTCINTRQIYAAAGLGQQFKFKGYNYMYTTMDPKSILNQLYDG
jgi:hypothetical protein